MNSGKDLGLIWKKLAWYAVKAKDNVSVANAFCLTSFSPITWDKGLALVYKDLRRKDGDLRCSRVFVSPSVDGWVFVVGFWAFSHLDHIGLSQMNQLCSELSKSFSEAQNFGTDDSTDYCQWVLAKNGKLVRSFEYLRGEVFLTSEIGLPTKEEIAIFGNKAQEHWSPSSYQVLELANLWSRNPASIRKETILEATGFLARTTQK